MRSVPGISHTRRRINNSKCLIPDAYLLGVLSSVLYLLGVLRHNSTLILIELGCCSFSQKPQYFWAFQRFKADPGSSRDRPFCVSIDFSAPRSKMSSLDYRRVRWILGAVRWIIAGFVGFLSSSFADNRVIAGNWKVLRVKMLIIASAASDKDIVLSQSIGIFRHLFVHIRKPV